MRFLPCKSIICQRAIANGDGRTAGLGLAQIASARRRRTFSGCLLKPLLAAPYANEKSVALLFP